VIDAYVLLVVLLIVSEANALYTKARAKDGGPHPIAQKLDTGEGAEQPEPYCFEVNEGELFTFAGIWDRWNDPHRGWIKTCSILTTAPNAVTSSVHDRMPVILDPDSYDLWLDPGMKNVDAASELLKPYDARLMRCYPVSSRINQVANDDQECSRPVESAPTQNRLFS
jgi:putative SOS response-associated peptidase YedK